MTPVRRWLVVALLAALAVGVPQAVRAWPAADSDVSAGELLSRAQAGLDHPYSGLVETSGTVQLPTAQGFDDLGLFGERSQLRVWWGADDAWRVDRLKTTGEDDLIRAGDRTIRYEYANARAAISRDPEIRLPRASDLLPPQLARLALDGVTADEVSRLPAERVAGIDAAGLRVVPTAPQTSIGHVDLWLDPASGVALRVEAYARDTSSAAFTSVFDSFSSAAPSAAEVAFDPSPGVERSFQDTLDIADAADQYAPLRPPDVVAGLPRTAGGDGAAGVYGHGLARILAVPLRDQDADAVRRQLAALPDADGTVHVDEESASVSVGPLSVRVGGNPGGGGWLVAGTVTPATLAQAVRDLDVGTVLIDPQGRR